MERQKLEQKSKSIQILPYLLLDICRYYKSNNTGNLICPALKKEDERKQMVKSYKKTT